ncbi:unnamed protein product [Discosporangium mesarthrocarpum]
MEYLGSNTKMSKTTPPRLTIEKLSKMTTYELRQEIDRRGLIGELKTVSHNTLLRRLVQVVLDEEDERGRADAVEDTEQDQSGSGDKGKCNVEERLRREKEERKAFALERSKVRQAQQGYFQEKKLANNQEKARQPMEDISEPSPEDSDPSVSKINPNGYKVFTR